MSEHWQDVDGYEGIYQVSSFGRVMRVAGGKGATPGHILKPIKQPDGYLRVALCRDGKRKHKLVHCLVAERFLGLAPEGCEANHKNGVRDDPRAENLEWVTRSENHKHAYRVLGRDPVCMLGESHGLAKLTARKVRQIRLLYASGKYTQRELGEMFGVHRVTIGCIVRRETWKHVP